MEESKGQVTALVGLVQELQRQVSVLVSRVGPQPTKQRDIRSDAQNGLEGVQAVEVGQSWQPEVAVCLEKGGNGGNKIGMELSHATEELSREITQGEMRGNCVPRVAQEETKLALELSKCLSGKSPRSQGESSSSQKLEVDTREVGRHSEVDRENSGVATKHQHNGVPKVVAENSEFSRWGKPPYPWKSWWTPPTDEWDSWSGNTGPYWGASQWGWQGRGGKGANAGSKGKGRETSTVAGGRDKEKDGGGGRH